MITRTYACILMALSVVSCTTAKNQKLEMPVKGEVISRSFFTCQLYIPPVLKPLPVAPVAEYSALSAEQAEEKLSLVLAYAEKLKKHSIESRESSKLAYSDYLGACANN
jgi:hypothetical protein